MIMSVAMVKVHDDDDDDDDGDENILADSAVGTLIETSTGSRFQGWLP